MWHRTVVQWTVTLPHSSVYGYLRDPILSSLRYSWNTRCSQVPPPTTQLFSLCWLTNCSQQYLTVSCIILLQTLLPIRFSFSTALLISPEIDLCYWRSTTKLPCPLIYIYIYITETLVKTKKTLCFIPSGSQTLKIIPKKLLIQRNLLKDARTMV